MKSRGFQAKSYSRRAFARHVHNHQVLCVRGAKFAVSIALSQIGCGTQLLWIDASTQHCCANVKKIWLFLPMDANMVSEHIIGLLFNSSRLQLEPQFALHFLQE